MIAAMAMKEAVLLQENSMKRALFWSNLLSEPLVILYGLVPFIACKYLGASAFLISLLAMLKPVMTVFSFYWGANLKVRPSKLKSNVMWAGLWMRFPFLLCPFFDSAWYLVFASVSYMFFYRASSPAWMEMLKVSLGEKERRKTFSLSSGLAYAEGVVLSLAVGTFLDGNPSYWKFLFPITAMIGLFSLVLQKRIVLPPFSERIQRSSSVREFLTHPWKESFSLLKKNREFASFQWGFMLAGFGLMFIQPTLTLFAVESLKVNYLEMGAAISVAKGLGFVLSSPVWSSRLGRHSLSKVASIVFLIIGLFPMVLLLSLGGIFWLYLAYFIYGIGLGGSHLVWNLSGPSFSKEEDSSSYTGAGVLFAGLRGCIGPSLGGGSLVLFGPLVTLGLGATFCLYSGMSLYKKCRSQKIIVDKGISAV